MPLCPSSVSILCWTMQNTAGQLSLALWNSFIWNLFVTLARSESSFTGRKKWSNLFTLSCSQVLSCVSINISMIAYFPEMLIWMMSPHSLLCLHFLFDSSGQMFWGFKSVVYHPLEVTCSEERKNENNKYFSPGNRYTGVYVCHFLHPLASHKEIFIVADNSNSKSSYVF